MNRDDEAISERRVRLPRPDAVGTLNDKTGRTRNDERGDAQNDKRRRDRNGR
jgi:hypothetical protein